MAKGIGANTTPSTRRDLAISFKAIKACYPFTIKGWLFSLLCYQPRAVPVYLTTLTPSIARGSQYWPLIWNGQAKAQPPNRFILGLTVTVNHETRNVTGSELPRVTPTLYFSHTYKHD